MRFVVLLMVIVFAAQAVEAQPTRNRNYTDRITEKQSTRNQRLETQNETQWRNRLKNSNLNRQVDRRHAQLEQQKRANEQRWRNEKQRNENKFKNAARNERNKFDREARRFRDYNG